MKLPNLMSYLELCSYANEHGLTLTEAFAKQESEEEE